MPATAFVNGCVGVGQRSADEKQGPWSTGGCASQGWLPLDCNAPVLSGLLGGEGIFSVHSILIQH